jgi:hypothetical protein
MGVIILLLLACLVMLFFWAAVATFLLDKKENRSIKGYFMNLWRVLVFFVILTAIALLFT